MDTDPNRLAQDARHDPHAFAALYDLYFPRVYNYIRYRCHDALTSDDLTSQVFERLLEKINRFSPQRGPFDSWLFTLVRNVVSDYYRKHRGEGNDWEDLEQQPAMDASLESQLIRRETEAELVLAISRLDARARDLLGLKFGARLTNRQIADLTHLSESNVGVILYRALAELRARIAAPDEVVANKRSVLPAEE